MKTKLPEKTNIISKILTIILISTSTFSCVFGERIKGNGIITKEERNINNFDCIKISAGLTVEITQGKKEFVEVKSDKNILKYIITELQNDNTLSIHWKKNTNIRSYKKAIIHVTLIQLKKIRASSGSEVISKNKIICNELKIIASSAASVDIDSKSKNLNAKVSSGAYIKLKGLSKIIKTNASSGGNIKAKDLIAERVIAKASSGASITITAKKELIANASSGGNIIFYGNPAIKNTNSSSGGDVDQK